MGSRRWAAAAMWVVLVGTSLVRGQPKGEQVTVTGTLVRNAGVQMIYIDTVK